jgi:hypothetical protein
MEDRSPSAIDRWLDRRPESRDANIRFCQRARFAEGSELEA